MSESSGRPREMIHRAQALASKWLYRFRRARKGHPDAVSEQRAESELHDAVMSYYEQIRRFRGRSKIKELWTAEAVGNGDGWTDAQGNAITLEEIAKFRLQVQREERVESTRGTGKREVVEYQQPWVMTPQQSLWVMDQLDKCAHALGFDANAESDDPLAEVEEADDVDGDGDEFGPNYVEVPDGN
jgi:hypothetical protein